MGENENLKSSPHIIIIAPPFQGHINPSIQFTLKLASKGFTITFVNTHATHHLITKAKKIRENDDNDNDNNNNVFAASGLDIRYRTISDGFPLSFDRSLHREQFLMGRIHVFPAHVDEIVGQLMRSEPRPSCLVADSFVTWGYDVARKHGLVFVSLWTQSMLVLSLYCHVDMLKENGHYGTYDNRKGDAIDYVPGVRRLETKDLVSILQETDTTTTTHKIIHKAFSDVKKADFIVCNTVEELEPEPISALKGIWPTYAIGPLFPSHFTNPSVEMDLIPQSDCTLWLDTKPHGSVLYASFGSYAQTNKEDIAAIAKGLMMSGMNFIWVLRPDIVSSEVTEFLPEGFLESVGSKGLVVPWCRQNEVLSHYAVGGFLTHCGWNSILESMWIGVPMICFPLHGDQITNRKMVVEDWEIGINLISEGNVVTCDEVAERIVLLMSGQTCDELRTNVGRLKKKLETALSDNGSSRVNLEAFIEDLTHKISMSG